MFCSNCGAKLDDSAVFCGECGTKLEAVATATVEETKEAIETKVEEVKEAVETKVEETKEAVEAKVGENKEAIETKVEETKEAVEAKVEETKEAVEAKVEEVKEAVEAKVEETKKVAEAVVAEAVAPVEKAVEEAPAPEKKKGGKGGLVALIIVVVLLLAGGGAAAWYFTSDGYNCKKNLKQAEEAFAAGELGDAKDYYEAVLEYDETQKDIYVKLADIAVQEGDYEAAINTLRKAIRKTKDVEGAQDELNAKLEETYMAAIDANLKNGSYTEALSLVEEAINEWNTPAWVQKKKDIYLQKINGEMAANDYWGAVTTAMGAFRENRDKDFAEKVADAYIILAQERIDCGEYTFALQLVEQGLVEVGDSQKLEDEEVVIYKLWIDRYIEEGNFNSAIKKAKSAYAETENEVFNEKIVDIYLLWADKLVEIGDYKEALDVLEDGVSDTQSEKLSAKIEEINNAEVLLSKEVIDRVTGTSVVYEYNEKGQETRIAYFDEYGSTTQFEIYEYDEEGNVTEYRTYDGEDTLLNCVLYAWTEVDGKKQCEITYVTYIDDVEYVTVQEIVDEKYNPLSYTEYKEDGSVNVLKQYEYDEAGNLLKEVIITDEETLVNQYAYTYDDAGNMMESVSFYDEETPKYRNTYDEKGNLIEIIEYDENGETVCTEQCSYDDKGNMLTYAVVSEEYNYHTEFTYDNDDEVIRYLYVDDISGDENSVIYNITKEDNVVAKESIEYFNGEEINYQKLVSEYDENGKLVHAELFDKDGMSIASDYIEYDEKGNETYALKGLTGAVEEYIINYEYGFPQ